MYYQGVALLSKVSKKMTTITLKKNKDDLIQSTATAFMTKRK